MKLNSVRDKRTKLYILLINDMKYFVTFYFCFYELEKGWKGAKILVLTRSVEMTIKEKLKER
jgi:hypothetical protein